MTKLRIGFRLASPNWRLTSNWQSKWPNQRPNALINWSGCGKDHLSGSSNGSTRLAELNRLGRMNGSQTTTAVSGSQRTALRRHWRRGHFKTYTRTELLAGLALKRESYRLAAVEEKP